MSNQISNNYLYFQTWATNFYYPTNISNGYITVPLSNWVMTTPSPTYIDHQLDLFTPEEKDTTDGCTCPKCKEHYPYAQPLDKEKFICWACKNGY